MNKPVISVLRPAVERALEATENDRGEVFAQKFFDELPADVEFVSSSPERFEVTQGKVNSTGTVAELTKLVKEAAGRRKVTDALAATFADAIVVRANRRAPVPA